MLLLLLLLLLLAAYAVPFHALLQPSSPVTCLLQVIELLWNLFELAPAAAADVLTTVERPKAAAAAATAVANDGQGTTQPCTAVIPAEPWVSRTEAGTPQDANMWTRSSPCASTSCSRPDSVADNDNMQAENQHAACGATAAVTQAMVQDDVRAATAQSCWPGSMVATPNQAGGQQLPHLVASLVDCLVSLLEHQMQHSHSLQVCTRRESSQLHFTDTSTYIHIIIIVCDCLTLAVMRCAE